MLSSASTAFLSACSSEYNVTADDVHNVTADDVHNVTADDVRGYMGVSQSSQCDEEMGTNHLVLSCGERWVTLFL